MFEQPQTKNQSNPLDILASKMENLFDWITSILFEIRCWVWCSKYRGVLENGDETKSATTETHACAGKSNARFLPKHQAKTRLQKPLLSDMSWRLRLRPNRNPLTLDSALPRDAILPTPPFVHLHLQPRRWTPLINTLVVQTAPIDAVRIGTGGDECNGDSTGEYLPRYPPVPRRVVNQVHSSSMTRKLASAVHFHDRDHRTTSLIRVVKDHSAHARHGRTVEAGSTDRSTIRRRYVRSVGTGAALGRLRNSRLRHRNDCVMT